jgi:hypothetical protein
MKEVLSRAGVVRTAPSGSQIATTVFRTRSRVEGDKYTEWRRAASMLLGWVGRSHRSAHCRWLWPGSWRRPPRWESLSEVEGSARRGSVWPRAALRRRESKDSVEIRASEQPGSGAFFRGEPASTHRLLAPTPAPPRALPTSAHRRPEDGAPPGTIDVSVIVETTASSIESAGEPRLRAHIAPRWVPLTRSLPRAAGWVEATSWRGATRSRNKFEKAPGVTAVFCGIYI